MNRGLLATGGTILIVGGILYWYLQQQEGWRCSDFHSEQECLAQDCYWYNGSCHSTPPGEEACWGGTKVCYYDGSTACDPYNNLCKCIDWKYKLFQADSPKCHSGLSHNECFPSDMGTATCVPIPGDGLDLCPRIGYSEDCSCVIAACDPYYFCDTRIYKCILKADLPISADNSNWEECHSTVKPYCTSCCDAWDHSGYTCDFDLGGEYAATSLTGQITFEWTTPISGIDTNIYGYLEGVGWTYLGYHHAIGEGPHNLIINFASQGISKLRFASCSVFWVNSKPKSFYGRLSF